MWCTPPEYVFTHIHSATQHMIFRCILYRQHLEHNMCHAYMVVICGVVLCFATRTELGQTLKQDAQRQTVTSTNIEANLTTKFLTSPKKSPKYRSRKLKQTISRGHRGILYFSPQEQKWSNTYRQPNTTNSTASPGIGKCEISYFAIVPPRRLPLGGKGG